MEINLQNPIFVIYVNVEGMSRQKANENLKNVSESYGQYTNATFWIFPVEKEETKIELIWNGTKYQLYNDPKDAHIKTLIVHVNEVLQILSDGTSDESIKSQLRNLQLSKVLD